MGLVCPHCQNSIELGEWAPTQEVLCPVCGSSFRLEPAPTTDWSGQDDRRTLGTSMAKAAVGECQQLVVQDGLQLHGGIGYTWEHDLHLYLKRAKSGDAQLGTAADHRARVAELIGLGAA